MCAVPGAGIVVALADDMLTKIGCPIVLLAAACVSPALAPDEQDDDLEDSKIPVCEIDLTSHLEPIGVPGLSAGIVKNGRLACMAVAGHADIESNRLVGSETVFHWASVSKAVTAVTAMTMFDDGLFDLDDNVETVLPFAVRNPHCQTEPITFRQLMTHTSSIVDADHYDDTYVVGDSPISLGDYVRGYFTPNGDYYDAIENFGSGCPGQDFEYSNIGVALLGHALEEISNQSFDELSRARVFDPLNMREASYRIANIDPDRLATPYDGHSLSTFLAQGQVGYPTLPDGMLRASIPELAKVLGLIAERGIAGERLLLETTVDEMARLQVPSLESTQGLLWFYDDGYFGHDGSDPGTSSFMYLDPKTSDGVLLVGNGDWYLVDDDAPAAYRLLNQLFEVAERQ